MTDRFDLEQEILECWRVTGDVEMVCENLMDRELSTDEVANALIGIKSLYNMRFEKLWSTFETMVRQRQFKKEDYVLEKEELIRQIKNLSTDGFTSGAEYSEGYNHGRDDAITIIETT